MCHLLKSSLQIHFLFPAFVSISTFLLPTAAQAQSITPDQTINTNLGTTVQQNGVQYNIDGGTLSGDATTLFHSFSQFGLLTGETVQFTNPATVQNIIGGVTGGNASFIDGLLTVDGLANLYLLNPSGILFGNNARLNLSGSFAALTATGTAFDDELFDIFSTTDFSEITGNPTGYIFAATQSGTIINAGDLTVDTNKSLTLLGGQVINTGTLSAPGGDILAMAVPGENFVRLSQDGSVLGLELETIPDDFSQQLSGFTPSTLPELLTGTNDLNIATEITVNPDGTVSLAGSSLEIPNGAGTTLVSGEVKAGDTQMQGGNIAILGEQVALIGATVNANGNTSGGTVLVGGDELGNGSVPNATATVIDQDSTVQADALANGNGGRIIAWGSNLLRMAGQLTARGGASTGDGGFIETSSLGSLEVSTTPDVSAKNGAGGLWLLDPPNIRIVEGTAFNNINQSDPFENGNLLFEPIAGEEATVESTLGVDLILSALSTGTSVEIRTTGDTPGEGNIIVDGAIDYDEIGDSNFLDLVADGEISVLQPIFDSNFDNEVDSLNLDLDASTITLQSTIDVESLTLEATESISVGGPTNAASLSLTAPTVFIESELNADFLSLSAETISSDNNINLGNLQLTNNLSTSITIEAPNQINIGDLVLFDIAGLSIISQQEGITTGNIQDLTNQEILTADSTNIVLQAPGPIVTGDISATGRADGFANTSGGNVTLQSQTSITTGAIDTSAGGNAGNVILDPPGDVVFTSIDASSTTGTAGNVTLVSTQGNVRGTGTIVDTSITINTDGATTDGTITIAHGGGTTIPFDIGNASINGTAGALSAGAVALVVGDPRNPFLGSFTEGNIQLIALDNSPITVIPETSPIPICVNDCNIPRNIDEPSTVQIFRGLPEIEDLFLSLEDRLTTEFVDYLSPGLVKEVPEPGQDNAFELDGPEVEADVIRAEADGIIRAAPTSITQASTQDAAAVPSFLEQIELGESPSIVTLPKAQNALLKVQQQTGKRPALIYAVFGYAATHESDDILQRSTLSDPLELLLVTAEGEPIYLRLPNVTRKDTITMAQRLRRQISNPSRVGTESYLESAQVLYQWLIPPQFQAELERQGIDTISFITDAGLRTTPLAALHDGQQFIIENYNIGLMPSLSLTDLTYRDIRNVDALVAGTSVFIDQAQLPGVPVELEAISDKWNSVQLQGNNFTLETLVNERQQNRYGIMHLATHGEFTTGDLSQSFLYLHDRKLAMDQLRQFGLHKPAVELLTLSACQTALGNRSAELGFAGFAVMAGAKTSVASLWTVSDEASAGLMIEFYQQLQGDQASIKAEALREAQLSMIKGAIFIEGNQLISLTDSKLLPPELNVEGRQDFSHPYYWAAFSLVGSPW